MSKGEPLGPLHGVPISVKDLVGAVPADTTRDAFGNNVYAGPLARTVTDAAIMHSVLAGPSEKDPWTLSGGVQHPLSPKLAGEDLSGVRIGYIELTANPRLAADVRANTRAALATFDQAKHVLTLEKRGLDFALAGLVFGDRHMTRVDDRRDYGEPRFVSIGRLAADVGKWP